MEFIPVNKDNPAHVEFLYKLLDERPPYANISHRGMPTFKQHEAFVRLEPYAAWYIVCVEPDYVDDHPKPCEMIGSVYFTHANEVGIFLLRKWQGKGYGFKVLAKAESMAPEKRILANIAPSNDRSLILFEKAGYRLIQKTYEKVVD